MKNSTRYLLSHLATRLGIAAFYSSMHLHPAGCEMPPEQKRTPAALRFQHSSGGRSKVFLPQRVWEDGDALGKAFLK